MAPTTRRQSRLLELGEVPGWQERKTGESDDMNKRESSSLREVVEKKKTNKEKIGKLGQKVKKGTRAKVRRTWDKLGILKEEVSTAVLLAGLELIFQSFALMTGHKKVNYEEKARVSYSFR